MIDMRHFAGMFEKLVPWVSMSEFGAEVVKYSGTLHQRSYPWMREDAETADLCLVLGTSLGGLNADQDLWQPKCGFS